MNRADGPRFPSRLVAGARLYWILVCASVRAKMQYKFDFVASAVIEAVTGMYDYFVIAVILWKFHTVYGWDIYEIGLLYAISKVGWGLYRLFGDEIERFENYVVRGDFDSILVRPWPSLFVLLSRNVELTRLGWLVQNIGLGAVSARVLMKAGVISRAAVGHLVIASVSTGCLFFAVGLATASAAFKIVRIEELQVFTENASSTATLYPLDVYPGWLKRMLLWVIPLGAGNYVPVKYLIGKGGTWFSLALPPVAAVASIYVAVQLWHLGESRYHSTGS